MFGFIKTIFLTGLAFLLSLVSTTPLRCISMNNQECKLRPEMINLNSNELVFYPFSRNSKTRHIQWHKTCQCECRLDASICNNKQCCKDDKCQCECKELVDEGVYIKAYAWNSSNCECECDKSCDVGEYLDYENCKSTKRLIDNLAEKMYWKNWWSKINWE